MRTVTSAMAILSLLLVFSGVFAAPAAPDYTNVGVKVGDTAVYRSSFSFTGVNETRVLVYGVVGTIVFLNYTDYLGGSPSFQGQWVGDIYIGAPPYFPCFLVAANLLAGDPIYSGAAQTVEDTSTRTLAGTARSVNHVANFGGAEIYWDQATGLMVELHLLAMGWQNYTLISTTAWSPPNLFNMTTIAIIEGIVIIILVIALVVVVARRRRRSRK